MEQIDLIKLLMQESVSPRTNAKGGTDRRLSSIVGPRRM